MKIKTILFFLCANIWSVVHGYEWTYRLGPDTVNNRPLYAYMWLPESCINGVRGLIMASHVSSEWQFVRNTEIRDVAGKEQLGIICFFPGNISVLSGDDTTYVLSALEKLADLSGFPEIMYAPWLTFGHSTGCLFAMHMAYWKPERTFGVICYKGGVVPNPAWCNGNIEGIPIMAVQGEFEEYDNTTQGNATNLSALAVRRDVIRYRHQSPKGHLMCATLLPGEGHMLWTKQGVGIIASFIGKAATYRIPKNLTTGGPGCFLNEISFESGWAAIGDPQSVVSPVLICPIRECKNVDSCYWFFDRQFADKWLALQSGTKKERQFVCPPHLPPSFSPEPLVPLSFGTNAKIYETRIRVGDQHRINGFSTTGLPVETLLINGPGQMADGKLSVNPANINDDAAIRIGLRQDGTEKFSIADRMLKVRFDRRSGQEQIITFKMISHELRPGDSIGIEASSGSGLPVTLSVNSGPAELLNNQLLVKPFVAKSGKTSIILRAGQEGNDSFATAQPVEMVIEVTNRQ